MKVGFRFGLGYGCGVVIGAVSGVAILAGGVCGFVAAGKIAREWKKRKENEV